MQRRRTPRNGLGITRWQPEPEDSPFMLDVPGLTFRGWWKDEAPEVGALTPFSDIWQPDSATFKIEHDLPWSEG
ncbi:MAG: hypothetical protein ACRD7E_16645, partial [Bryobacteraceae bacterium]